MTKHFNANAESLRITFIPEHDACKIWDEGQLATGLQNGGVWMSEVQTKLFKTCFMPDE
jgi:hypothetical protein